MEPIIRKVALVTGGSRGIGAAIALRIAREGADVAITYVQHEACAKSIIQQVESLGRRGLAILADIGDPMQVKSSVEQVVRKFGHLDILVNNAGVGEFVPFVKVTLEMLNRLIDVNIRGVFLTSQEAVKMMNPGGRIVNIGSINAERAGIVGMSGYAMTKSAIAGLTRGMARDLGECGITVNLIQPGAIETDMNPIDSPWAERTIGSLVVPRYGMPEEIASGVAYLISVEANYVTGTTLTIDGGFLS